MPCDLKSTELIIRREALVFTIETDFPDGPQIVLWLYFV